MPRARIARRGSRPPYTSSPVTNAARIPRSCARCSSVPASSGSGGHHLLGHPASSRCSSPAAHAPGRYSARPVSVWPRDAAKVKVTATWHSAIPPAVPEYWRAAPPRRRRTSHRRSRPRPGPRPRHPAGHRPGRCRIQDLLVIPDRPGQQMLQPVRATIPAASAMLQQLQSSSSISSPSTISRRRPGGSPAAENTLPPARTGPSAKHEAGHRIAWQQRLPRLDCLSRFIMTAAAAPLPRHHMRIDLVDDLKVSNYRCRIISAVN